VRYAVCSDIHGNHDALDAVLRSIRMQSIDQVVCLGDVVGYGPQPLECLRSLRRVGALTVAGNHDFAVAQKIDYQSFNVYARAATDWTRDVLGSEWLDHLAALPLVREFDGFTAVHATLHSPELFDYVQSCYDASLALAVMEQPLCFIGHSHVPVAFAAGEYVTYRTSRELRIGAAERVIVNVGSVGQPRDQDPRASYAIYDADARTVTLERVAYDIESTIRKISAVGLPPALGERLRFGR